LPYAITGRAGSATNAAARALLALLAILPSRFPASALLELLQMPLIGRRFDVGAEELAVIEDWLGASGIRWALDAQQRRELGLPGTERFTIADGLDRLFLGYALPQRVSAPPFGRIPAGNAEGSQAEILGSFAEFIEQLTALRMELREPRLPEAWLGALFDVLDSFLAPTNDDLEDVAEVRATLRKLQENMRRGGLAVPVPLAVLRAGLESLFDDAARGGVPTGSITFSSMSSLRNLPFRFVGIIGLDDGAFPAAARPREFDLMASEPRAGDRQRRLDDRNLFLDLLLAARERLYLSYTGRSIRDNSVRPPSVVVAELLETLLPALARRPGEPEALAEARAHLIIEHPLQAFAESYFRDGDPRRRSFNRELCEALRCALQNPASVAAESAATDAAEPADEAESADEGQAADDAASGGGGAARFFAAPLSAPGAEWQRVSLEQLLKFFRNPCHFLLRQRLGMSLYREEDSVSDDEPFTPDFLSRQALAERLLPHAMRGMDQEALRRLAEAGIEYPPGALGLAALKDEMSSLQRYALEVRDATQAPRLPPLTVDLPFMLHGEDWALATTITERREAGLVLRRYDDTRPGDYLAGWLTHLVAAAASQAPTETRWISRDGSFRFTACTDARSILESLLLLYRRGLREPIHFFPKSAWAYMQGGRHLGKARAVWHATYGGARGEDQHEAYRLALRGSGDPLDADFAACAETVFGRIGDYLDDPRL
jgi:exodeoxyribonuclease V gamma subunit